VTLISSVLVISETHDELLAKKSTGKKSGNNSSDTTSSNSSSSSSSVGNNSGSASDLNIVAPVNKTRCDKKGYPSCYNLGYSDGQNAPGTSCPSGHSEAYCNGYEAASLSGNSPPVSSPPPFFGTQNPRTKINQGAESNANMNVSNSSGTHIANEQIIKQSVKINNKVKQLNQE